MGYLGVSHYMEHTEGTTYRCAICRKEFTIERDWLAKPEIRNTPLPNGTYYRLSSPVSFLMESEASNYVKSSSIDCTTHSILNR